MTALPAALAALVWTVLVWTVLVWAGMLRTGAPDGRAGIAAGALSGALRDPARP